MDQWHQGLYPTKWLDTRPEGLSSESEDSANTNSRKTQRETTVTKETKEVLEEPEYVYKPTSSSLTNC